MFPSNSTSHHNPFSFSDHSFDFQTNPPSKQETDNQFPNFSFSDFPSSPFEDYQFFLNQQQPHDFPEPEQLSNHHEPQQVMMNMNMRDEIKKTMVTRKRQGKRDRHSKINTARGLRDRRMRLSLQVAKRFFHLQDMLGFEKASKTVEWLLNQAKEEIKQVAAKTASSTSECELGLSSSPEEVVVDENQEEEKKLKALKRRTKVRSGKISAFHHPLAKVSREKARERARERTKEKMRSKS